VTIHDYGSFRDDTERIPNEATLLRRIFPRFVEWSGVGEAEKPDLPRQGFQDYPEDVAQQEFNLPGACMSVAVEEMLAEAGYDASKIIEDYPGYGVAAVSAGAVRTLEGPDSKNWAQGVMWNPTDSEPWHAVVYCKVAEKKTRGMENALRLQASWRIVPAKI
jgi:hypothetical protein